jgi:uncharacterized protein
MRTSNHIFNHILSVALFSLGLGVTTAYALDPKSTSPDKVQLPGVGVGPSPQAPRDGGPASLRSWVQMLQAGDIPRGVPAADAAFRSGDAVAGWRLGRMFADGDGVKQDHARAFEYFRQIAENTHFEEVHDWRPIADKARVELGRYYLTGIANSAIKADPARAQHSFSYAALIFNDADAKYHLGRMYLEGQGIAKDPHLGVKWIGEAAAQDQYEAQAKLGRLLVEGVVVRGDVAKGLAWLRVAGDMAPIGEPKDRVRDIYNAAYDQATKDERAAAEVHYLKLKRSRSGSGAGYNPD